MIHFNTGHLLFSNQQEHLFIYNFELWIFVFVDKFFVNFSKYILSVRLILDIACLLCVQILFFFFI